jgi:hypothetical protein
MHFTETREEKTMSEGLAVDFAEVVQDHIFWIGAVIIVLRLL